MFFSCVAHGGAFAHACNGSLSKSVNEKDMLRRSTFSRGAATPEPPCAVAAPAEDHDTGNKGKGVWTGPQHPNKTKLEDNDAGCPTSGCLFDIEQDPTEHNDLAKDQPDLAKQLLSELQAVAAGAYQTGDDQYKGDYTNCTTIDKWIKKYPGFGGPLCYKGPIPI